MILHVGRLGMDQRESRLYWSHCQSSETSILLLLFCAVDSVMHSFQVVIYFCPCIKHNCICYLFHYISLCNEKFAFQVSYFSTEHI